MQCKYEESCLVSEQCLNEGTAKPNENKDTLAEQAKFAPGAGAPGAGASEAGITQVTIDKEIDEEWEYLRERLVSELAENVFNLMEDDLRERFYTCARESTKQFLGKLIDQLNYLQLEVEGCATDIFYNAGRSYQGRPSIEQCRQIVDDGAPARWLSYCRELLQERRFEQMSK